MSGDVQRQGESPLTDLVRPAEYLERPAVANKFASAASLLWFIRRYRHRLIEADALVMIANRLYLRPEAADRVILAVGIEAARGQDVADAA